MNNFCSETIQGANHSDNLKMYTTSVHCLHFKQKCQRLTYNLRIKLLEDNIGADESSPTEICGRVGVAVSKQIIRVNVFHNNPTVGVKDVLGEALRVVN